MSAPSGGLTTLVHVAVSVPDAVAAVLTSVAGAVIALEAPAVAPGALSPEDRAALEARIALTPGDYAATAAIAPSTVPCVTAQGLQPRPVVLRMFLVHDGDRWHAMEGGLARVLDDEAGLAGGLPGGGLSKDVWVLHEGARNTLGPLPQAPAPLPIRRSTGELPSRVADDFFWLGRYVERLDAWARLARSVLNRVARGAPLPHELAELRAHDGVVPISLGPRTLRAETAALAALACWQALYVEEE